MRTDTVSHQDKIRVFQEIEKENSGRVYIYTAPSVRSELEHMKKIRENPEVSSNESLSNFTDHHIERTSAQIGDFEREGEEVMIALKSPPKPTPPPATEEITSIHFFTTNPNDRIELVFNNRPVKIRYLKYDSLTQIQTVLIPGKIKYKKGQQLGIRLNVSYKEDTGKINTKVVEWAIRF